MRKCKRCGTCCNLLPLSSSPAQLRKAFDDWNIGKKNRVKLVDIHLIWPMLVDRCIGRHKKQYVYGPCRFLEKTGSKSRCIIEHCKPDMCSHFPYYGNEQKLDMGMHGPNPSHVKGCGFNVDQNHGIVPSEWKLKPLKKSEK